MKNRISRIIKVVSGALLSLLGFSSCSDSIFNNGTERVMYGVPHADYDFSGTVTDTDGKGIEGIQVVFRPDKESYWDNDTLRSDASGRFSTRLKYQWPGLQNNSEAEVIFEDTDGEANGGTYVTRTLSTKDLTIKRTKKGDGSWNEGTWSVQANTRLDKQ